MCTSADINDDVDGKCPLPARRHWNDGGDRENDGQENGPCGREESSVVDLSQSPRDDDGFARASHPKDDTFQTVP